MKEADPTVTLLNHAKLAVSLTEVAQTQVCVAETLLQQKPDRFGNVRLTRSAIEIIARTLRKSALIADQVAVMLDGTAKIDVREIKRT